MEELKIKSVSNPTNPANQSYLMDNIEIIKSMLF